MGSDLLRFSRTFATQLEALKAFDHNGLSIKQREYLLTETEMAATYGDRQSSTID
jgi:hypothetical protein